MKKLPFLFLIFSLFLAGCGDLAFAAPEPTTTSTETPLPTSTTTDSPSLTPTITQTFTPSPVPTATWVFQGPNTVNVPILMYHHVEENPITSNYRISAARFDEQMKLLHDWEYTTITTQMLVEAITHGYPLPPRPIIITFDDGNLNNYTTAFPIMQKYGFTGVLYVVANYVGADNFMNEAQIVEMYNAGWEIGSHSISHLDLIGLDPERQRYEIVESRQILQDRLGVPVMTFAYPFGSNSSGVVDYVHYAGYIAAMGATGFRWEQGSSNLFVLQRCEIKGSEDAKTFIRFLPWWGDPIFLPTDTPTPTLRPTRTPIPTYTQYPTKTPSP